MPEKDEDILDSLKRNADRLIEDLKKIDIDKEATSIMNETEKVLTHLSGHIERKRMEMEKAGVKDTIKKDLGDVEKGVEKIIKDLEKIMK